MRHLLHSLAVLLVLASFGGLVFNRTTATASSEAQQSTSTTGTQSVAALRQQESSLRQTKARLDWELQQLAVQHYESAGVIATASLSAITSAPGAGTASSPGEAQAIVQISSAIAQAREAEAQGNKARANQL